MNEKIKELARKAGLEDQVTPFDEFENLELQAFAELIIRDVLSNVWDEVQYSTSQGIANEIDGKLKKLYGVEE